jgi:cell division protein FtsI/penicillin-binding protein 2
VGLLVVGFAAGLLVAPRVIELLRATTSGAAPGLPSVSTPPEVASVEPPSAAAPLPDPPEPPRVPESILSVLPPSAREGVASRVELPRGAALSERVEVPAELPEALGPLEVEYTIDPVLTREVGDVLQRGRVALGHVIVLDALDGRVLAYVSTDPQKFPATRAYPMASLMKVVTASAVLRSAPDATGRPCVYRGSPWALSPALLDPPRAGRVTSFEHALAMSNNQCFARLAVHALGQLRMLDEMTSLGVLESPGAGHAAGEVDPVETRLDLGELGSGLAGSRFSPLAAARLAATLADGQLVTPRWIERVTDANGVSLLVPAKAPRTVLTPEVVRELRTMLVETTLSGTARRAFRGRKGQPLLGPIRVAGKTGSLSGPDPAGRYEWFIGVAPAEAPQVAVAALVVNRGKWWKSASQVAAEVLQSLFCAEGPCRRDATLAGQPAAAIERSTLDGG